MNVFKYIFVLFLVFIPFIGNAQVSYFDNLAISISPSNPQPGETVTLTTENFSFEKNQSYFTWYVDGFIIKEGFGEDKITLEAGESNSKNLVTLTVNANNDLFLEEQVTIQPVDVTLIWQANTHTPMFYKGKALHTPGSSVQFLAIADVFQNGVKIPAKNLVYTWKNDKKILGSLSGIGKDSIILENKGILRDLIVSVEVSTADGLISGRDTVVVIVNEPEVFFYENDPLIGIKYEREIGKSFPLVEQEISISSEPFFFSFGNLSYSWKINGRSIDNNSKNILLSSSAETSSSSNISVEISHPNYFLQEIKRSFEIRPKSSLLENLFNF